MATYYNSDLDKIATVAAEDSVSIKAGIQDHVIAAYNNDSDTLAMIPNMHGVNAGTLKIIAISTDPANSIAPAFTSFGCGTFNTHGKSKSSKLVWNCCYCGDGGMAVHGFGDCCPSCGHQKCAYCTEQKGRGRS